MSGMHTRAEYLAKQGLSYDSIYRMIKFEFGEVPTEKRLRNLVECEKLRREYARRRYG